MGPFRVDFAMNRGHELILDREQPIKREELDAMELQMLRSNQVPFLLPVEWIEIDGNVTFRYSIEGRRMLSHQLQLQTMTMQQFYMCLLAITEALDACKSYLLRPECCLLEEMYIFVGERWDDVSLLYVPFRNNDQATDELSSFVPLVMRLAAHVQQLDGGGLQSILRQINDSRSVRPALIRTLLQLISGEHGEPAASTAASSIHPMDQTMAGGYRWNEQLLDERNSPKASLTAPNKANGPMQQQTWKQTQTAQQPHLIGTTNSNSTDMSSPAPVYSAVDAAPRSDNMSSINPIHSLMEQPSFAMPQQQRQELLLSTLEDGDDEELASQQQSRNKWLLICGTAIVIALIWRYTYADHPSSSSLLLATGASLCMAAGLFYLLRRQKNNDILGQPQPHLSSGAIKGQASDSAELNYWPESRLLEERSNSYGASGRLSSVPTTGKPSSRDANTPTHGGASNKNLVSPSADATVWMGGGAATQQLGGSEALEGKGAKHPRWGLERSWKGKSDQYLLPTDASASAILVIGRFSEKVDIADDHPGISRVHVEFGRSEDGCMAKDMGSRNGTTLNGSPMIAYKSYNLSNGDTLQLAGNAGPIYTVRQVG